MYFHYVKQYDGLTVAPSLLASVFVDVNLEIKVFIFSKLMANASNSHMLLLPTLPGTSELRKFCFFVNLSVTAKKILFPQIDAFLWLLTFWNFTGQV